MTEEFLSIKDFAKAVNVSPQAVYQRLKSKRNDEIKKYTRTEDGRTVINIQARELFEKAQGKDPQMDEVNASPMIDEKLINTLTAQLEAKDKQLADQNKQLDQMQHRLEEAHRLTEQQQMLSLGYQKELTAARDKQKALEAELSEYKSIDQAPTADPVPDDPGQEIPIEAATGDQERGKAPFADRLKMAWAALTGKN